MSIRDQHALLDPPTAFSTHHLSWLYRNGFLPDLPLELGPFPLTPVLDNADAFDAMLRDQLVSWDLLREGELNPEARFLFETLLGLGTTWSLWGTVLLHSLKTNARANFDPDGLDEWGLKHAVRDIPRVQFMICATNKEFITALNAPPNLIMNRIPVTSESLHLQAGRILKAMLDPTQQWNPWPGPAISAPMTAIVELAENPETSRLDLEDDALLAQRPGTVRRLLLDKDMSAKTAEALAELSRLPTTAAAQVSLNYPTPAGQLTPKVSMGVAYLDGAGVMVSYPMGKTERTRTLYYAPGDDQGFSAGVKSLLDAAETETETR